MIDSIRKLMNQVHHLKIVRSCPYCGMEQTSRGGLRQHISRKHREVHRLTKAKSISRLQPHPFPALLETNQVVAQPAAVVVKTNQVVTKPAVEEQSNPFPAVEEQLNPLSMGEEQSNPLAAAEEQSNPLLD